MEGGQVVLVDTEQWGCRVARFVLLCVEVVLSDSLVVYSSHDEVERNRVRGLGVCLRLTGTDGSIGRI